LKEFNSYDTEKPFVVVDYIDAWFKNEDEDSQLPGVADIKLDLDDDDDDDE